MTPTPQHGSPAGDAIIEIRKLSRWTGANVQQLMMLYALEGLLTRIALSEYHEDFVLKGGVLLAAFAVRRPTKDIDVQATRLGDNPDEVAERVRAIAALQVADYGYVLETGDIVLEGPAKDLADNPRVIESYLGLGNKKEAEEA